jgi:hypothetical protein
MENIVPKRFLELVDEKDAGSAATEKGVDWRSKNFFGTNNKIIHNLSYLVDIPDYKMLRLVVTDADK